MVLPRVSSVRAVTLIEIVVVVGLLVVIAALGLMVSMDDYRAQNFHTERDTVVSVLHKARSQAVNNMCFGVGCTDGKAHGVHVANGEYVVFQGATYATRDVAVDEVITAGDAATVVTGPTDVIFTQLSGMVNVNPVGANSMTITGPNRISVITIGPEGTITWTH